MKKRKIMELERRVKRLQKENPDMVWFITKTRYGLTPTCIDKNSLVYKLFGEQKSIGIELKFNGEDE